MTHVADQPGGGAAALGESGSGVASLAERRLRHDLRQSLASVMMLDSVLDRRTLDDPHVRSYLRQVRREVEWVTRLVDRTVAGPRLVDVGAAATRAWEASSGASSCRSRISRNAPAWVEADETELERCLRNLLDNATRASGPDGQVDVLVDRSASTVLVEIADSGPGFGRVPPQQCLGFLSVSAFAADNGGVLSVGASMWGGALVRLVLPRAGARATGTEGSRS
jgi:signal transduction histidine kinase